jgi:HSP90 family molecular chaperone
MDDCEALTPIYLRFVKGVVDARDLSLNVSREILQQDRQIQLIRRRLVKKVLATVKEMMTEHPERYRTFWDQFGRAVKEGCSATTRTATPSSTSPRSRPPTTTPRPPACAATSSG